MARQPQPSAAIKVRVQPRASRDQVLGWRGDVWRVRVTAPPDDGKANAAVIALLAGALGVPRGRVRIIRGHASRDKLVEVESLGPEEVRLRLDRAAG